MKKLLAILLVIAMMTIALTGCGTSTNENKVIRIGVMQFGEFTALQNAYNGFVDGLKAAGFEDGKNIKINYQSAAGDTANCPTIADTLINDNSDLILAIATPSILALKQKTETIPCLFTAVTDPVASGLVASKEKPGANITGTSDMNPVAKQIDLLKKLIPGATRVAVLYCSSESNSAVQFELAKAQIEALGMTCVEKTITAIDEAKAAIESLKGNVDAIYIPTDNTLADGMTTVAAVANEQKLPIVAGEGGMVQAGATATIGIDYYELGKQTAEMAVRILKEGAKPADMAVGYQTDDNALVNAFNTESAAACGITIPEDLLNGADTFPQ